MYVIYPADELIVMTYDLAIPLIQSRPTLDCLREPIIPFGNISLSPSSAQAAFNQEQKTAYLPMYSNTSNGPSSSRVQSREPSIGRLSYTTTSGQENYEFKPNETEIHDYDHTVDYANDEYEFDQNPNIFVEPPTPNLVTTSHQLPKSSTKNPPAKSKLRPKIHLSLGRLGGQKPNLSESNRIKEDLQLDIENPTFTRENLRQRNFDAFFESGEPVYKLQPKSTNSAASNCSEQNNAPTPLPNKVPSPSITESPSKFKPKIHLSIGRFGGQKPDLKESSRLKEDLQLDLENPTFTRENLRQQNFDAFFESGKPVYNLQTKTPNSASANSPDSFNEMTHNYDPNNRAYESPSKSKPRSLRLISKIVGWTKRS